MFEVRKDLAWDLSTSKYVFQVASQNVDRDVQALVEWLNSDEQVQEIMQLPQSREALTAIKSRIDSAPGVSNIILFPMMLGLIG